MIIRRAENSDKISINVEDEIKIINLLFEKYREIFFIPAIIAYSGGRDSTVLLYIYSYLAKQMLIPEPIIFHLNHMIRDNRDQEENIYTYLKSFQNNVYFLSRDIPKLAKKLKRGVEETGRLVRYKIMTKISEKQNRIMVTGHHSVDYLESILIHFIRGGGEKAMTALPIYKNNIFRPLLSLKIDEIDKLYKFSKLKIFEDESNESELYLRNRIRKNVVYYLLKEGLDTNKLYDNFHNEEIEVSNLKFHKNYIRISGDDLNKFNRTELKKLLDIYLEKLRMHPIKKKLLLEIEKRIQAGEKIFMENSEVFFWKTISSDLFILKKNTSLFREATRKDGYISWNDRKFPLQEGTSIRFYQNGSKIQKNGILKEISEILRVNQIPEPVRSYFPIIYRDENPIIIPFNLWHESMKDFNGDKV